MSKWTCADCDWHGTDDQFLVAFNPFKPGTGESILGCPQCKEVNTMLELCDEPGCLQLAGCGFPTDDGGFRRTCFNHSKYKQDKDRKKS